MAFGPFFHGFHDEVVDFHLRASGERIPLQLIFPVRVKVEDRRVRPALHRPAAA